MALSITDLKKGTIFEFENQPFRVVEYAQKVMGRGGSIVNVRIKSLVDGKVLDKTFKGNEQLNNADVHQQAVIYLYADDKKLYFMNEQSFEQYSVNKSLIGQSANYLKEGDKIDLQLFKGQAIGLIMPKNVSLKVTYTEAAVKGDTSTSITKDAVVETGLTVRVPAFIKTGDIISIDTASGVYRERIKL